MKQGRQLPLGAKATQPTPIADGSPTGPETPPRGAAFGDVLTPPRASYRPGGVVRVVFAGAYPNNDLRHGSTYLTVERRVDGRWRRVADDGDWSTRLRWARLRGGSAITITWAVPRQAAPGTYRVRYRGDARAAGGALTPVRGTSPVFRVTR
ncbi:neutral/alkaline non-lysosomal ceramidase C-terminal domain-containing protein [Nocardioides sp. TF02-7]|nr:neutral/alkaline non-lysosomal ceramidase C-terminal domain-containing protein [Nocardioides sp. TF02-7]